MPKRFNTPWFLSKSLWGFICPHETKFNTALKLKRVLQLKGCNFSTGIEQDDKVVVQVGGREILLTFRVRFV